MSPSWRQSFGLDAEAVAQVRDWLAEARLRWGLDAAHKARLGLPEVTENTWAQVEQRLFGGYALAGRPADPGDDCEPGFAGIAPIAGVEGTAAQVLGRFWHLLDLLRETAAALARPRPAADWQEDLTADCWRLLRGRGRRGRAHPADPRRPGGAGGPGGLPGTGPGADRAPARPCPWP